MMTAHRMLRRTCPRLRHPARAGLQRFRSEGAGAPRDRCDAKRVKLRDTLAIQNARHAMKQVGSGRDRRLLGFLAGSFGSQPAVARPTAFSGIPPQRSPVLGLGDRTDQADACPSRCGFQRPSVSIGVHFVTGWARPPQLRWADCAQACLAQACGRATFRGGTERHRQRLSPAPDPTHTMRRHAHAT